jgi:hypothetical protein
LKLLGGFFFIYSLAFSYVTLSIECKKMCPFNSIYYSQPHAAFPDVSNADHQPLQLSTAAGTYTKSLFNPPGTLSTAYFHLTSQLSISPSNDSSALQSLDETTQLFRPLNHSINTLGIQYQALFLQHLANNINIVPQNEKPVVNNNNVAPSSTLAIIHHGGNTVDTTGNSIIATPSSTLATVQPFMGALS